MAHLTAEQSYEKVLHGATNSSHFVCLLAKLKAYECKTGWVFFYESRGSVTLIALDPVFTVSQAHLFEDSWMEFALAVRSPLYAFVSIYTPFADLLRTKGFQVAPFGEEPWVDLKEPLPKGNKGKGVRTARNQAIHAGLTVAEWKAQDLTWSPEKQNWMTKLLAEWKGRKLVLLEGFLNATDPLFKMECRRYFVALNRNQNPVAYLVATPVKGQSAYFLEDLIASDLAPRGTGELLTTEALRAIQGPETLTASLGVVSATKPKPGAYQEVPPLVSFLLGTLPGLLKRMYNFEGLQIFRKRFKPTRWDTVHLAVLNSKSSQDSGFSDTRAWLTVLAALGLAFKPRLEFSPKYRSRQLLKIFKRTPITLVSASLALVLFACINRFGSLPTWALSRFGFSGNAPLTEWPMRSIVSDMLYFDAPHFLIWGCSFFALLYWSETTQRRKFFIPFFLITSFFDDLINYWLLILPFSYFHPKIFNQLIDTKDVGSSLIMVTFLGLQLCQFKKNREVYFSVAAMGTVFGFVFASEHFHSLVLNLNHFLFLSLGFIMGKFLFLYEKSRNDRASKGRPAQLNPR